MTMLDERPVATGGTDPAGVTVPGARAAADRAEVVPARPRATLSERIVAWVSRRLSPAPDRDAPPGPPRRSFLGGAALVGAAVAASPWGYLTRPANAYDAICGSGNTCNDGWSVFCCTINGGQNSCPPNSFIGGWWKADHSSFCGGSARYYIDCNAFRNGAWQCRCNQSTCDQRLVACNQFRYGQCNLQVPYSNTGPVVCRVVSCTPPWVQFGGVCTSSSLTDNNTATHSAPCLIQPATLRIAVVGNDDSAIVKAGSLYAGWVGVAGNVASMAVTGTRVGVVDRSGVAQVKEGELTAGWVGLATGVAALALDANNRLAILGTDGTVRMKEGALTGAWTTVADQCTAMSIDGGRIGVVRNNRALVKEGAITAPWVEIGNAARAVVIDGFRTVVVQRDGTALIRDGALDSAPATLATGVASVSLDGSRIGVLLTDGRFLVKDGEITAPWVTVASGVVQAVVRGDRIATVDAGGTVRVKEGVVAAVWVTERTGARGVVLS